MEHPEWKDGRVGADLQGLRRQVLAGIRNKEQVGLNEIKRVFDDYLEEKYIEDDDILEYIKEFDKDSDGISLMQAFSTRTSSSAHLSDDYNAANRMFIVYIIFRAQCFIGTLSDLFGCQNILIFENYTRVRVRDYDFQ